MVLNQPINDTMLIILVNCLFYSGFSGDNRALSFYHCLKIIHGTTKAFLSKMRFTIDCQVLFYVRSDRCMLYFTAHALRHISITIRVFYQYAVRSYQIACDWSQLIHTSWLHYARQDV